MHIHTYTHAQQETTLDLFTTTQPQGRAEEQFKAMNEKKQKQNDEVKAATSKPFHWEDVDAKGSWTPLLASIPLHPFSQSLKDLKPNLSSASR